MPVPDYETLMLPVLRALAAGASTVRDCLPALGREFAITATEAAELQPSGGKTILADRAHRARTHPGEAGEEGAAGLAAAAASALPAAASGPPGPRPAP